MNSVLKQPAGQERLITTETFVELFEKKLLSLTDISEVELLGKKLKFLGMNFDPFDQEVTSDCRQIMDDLRLTPHLTNPYLATNILLRLLDKTEERLSNLKQ